MNARSNIGTYNLNSDKFINKISSMLRKVINLYNRQNNIFYLNIIHKFMGNIKSLTDDDIS